MWNWLKYRIPYLGVRGNANIHPLYFHNIQFVITLDKCCLFFLICGILIKKGARKCNVWFTVS